MKNLIEKIFLFKTEREVTKELSKNENLVVFHLKNSSSICYLVDLFSLNNIRKRLKGGKVGVLAINKENKIDLNQVEVININNNQYVDYN